MTYLVVCSWDENGKSPAYRIEETEELAQAAVARILPENSEVFYCETPAGDPAYFVVNADAQTVAEDSATRSADELAAKWASIRSERDALLAASDWRAMSDAPTMSADWTNYRKALRNLPASQSDPDDITFPTEPSS